MTCKIYVAYDMILDTMVDDLARSNYHAYVYEEIRTNDTTDRYGNTRVLRWDAGIVSFKS